MAAPIPYLPPEILDLVVKHTTLGVEAVYGSYWISGTDRDHMKNLRLVSKGFAAIAQKLLFHTISVTSACLRRDGQDSDEFYQKKLRRTIALANSPMAMDVREVHLDFGRADCDEFDDYAGSGYIEEIVKAVGLLRGVRYLHIEVDALRPRYNPGGQLPATDHNEFQDKFWEKVLGEVCKSPCLTSLCLVLPVSVPIPMHEGEALAHLRHQLQSLFVRFVPIWHSNTDPTWVFPGRICPENAQLLEGLAVSELCVESGASQLSMFLSPPHDIACRNLTSIRLSEWCLDAADICCFIRRHASLLRRVWLRRIYLLSGTWQDVTESLLLCENLVWTSIQYSSYYDIAARQDPFVKASIPWTKRHTLCIETNRGEDLHAYADLLRMVDARNPGRWQTANFPFDMTDITDALEILKLKPLANISQGRAKLGEVVE